MNWRPEADMLHCCAEPAAVSGKRLSVGELLHFFFDQVNRTCVSFYQKIMPKSVFLWFSWQLITLETVHPSSPPIHPFIHSSIRCMGFKCEQYFRLHVMSCHVRFVMSCFSGATVDRRSFTSVDKSIFHSCWRFCGLTDQSPPSSPNRQPAHGIMQECSDKRDEGRVD